MAHLARLVLGVVLASGPVLAAAATAQPGDDAEALSAQVVKLSDERKFTETIPLAQRVLASREKTLGPDHPDVATAFDNLAALYRELARYTEAEVLYKRSLAIREKALALDHPDLAMALNSLALQSARRHWALTTPMSRWRSTAWLHCTRSKPATPTPSRSTSGRWASPKKCKVPTNPTSALHSPIRATCTASWTVIPNSARGSADQHARRQARRARA